MEKNAPYKEESLSIYERKVLSKYDETDYDLSAKERLMKFAIKSFALNGYEKTSIRNLAAEANVNISAVSYYFKDKEGLYKAVLELIGKRLEVCMTAVAREGNKDLEGKDITSKEAKEVIRETFRRFIYFQLNDNISPHVSKIIVREHMEPSSGFDDFYKNSLVPLHEEIMKFISKITGYSVNSTEGIICYHSFVGMLMMFKTHREAALRRLGWKGYGDEELEQIINVVGKNLEFLIDGYSNNKKS